MLRPWIVVACVSTACVSPAWGDTPSTADQSTGASQSTGTTAQTSGSTTQPTAPVPAFINLTRVSSDYQVGPGDLLDIQVVGHTEISQALRVSNVGEISFPMLGLIRVTDLTPFETEELIAKRLREKGLIQDPEVLVSVTEYQAKPIFVSGAVVNPGEFVMSQELTVADAILLAGGLQFNAGDEGFVHRRVSEIKRSGPEVEASATPSPGEPGVALIRVNLKPLKEGRFFEAALQMRRGDVLVIPQQVMHPYFVVGEVVEPHNYFFPPGRTLMASQAISFAKGPLPTAKLSKGMLVRYGADGNRKELKVDYKGILDGTQKDFAIQPNDIIFIPGSKIKTITHGLLLMTDTMVMQQSFRIGRRIQLPEPPNRTPTDHQVP